MNIVCITHAAFEPPGIIETWAQEKDYSFAISRPYKGDVLSQDFDFLIIMGGPQSPCEVEKYPYLNDEIALIKYAIHNNKRVLGFCLGAQLIGEALEAKTMRSPEKEVGVYPLTLTKAGLTDPLLQGFPETFSVIHWHNDMPGLTERSTLLAHSAGCPQQIIRYLPHVYGFQCHLEITLEGIKTMIDAVPEDLSPSRFTQSREELFTQDYNTIHQKMHTILDRLVVLPLEERQAAS